MDPRDIATSDWMARPTLYPVRAVWLRRLDALAEIIGMAAVIVGHGLRQSGILPWEFGAVVLLSMAVITIGIALRYRWSLAQRSFRYRHLWTVLAAAAWVAGLLVVVFFGGLFPDTNGPQFGGRHFWGMVHISEVILTLYSISGIIRGLRRITAGAINPAFLLVMSFLVLISVGTAVLMLPICRNFDTEGTIRGAPFLTALFTATSASCVTGLVIESTGTYWSRTGQLVILALMQVGGLGIMTFGAFFAVVAGRNVRLTEFATLRDLFASESFGDVRKLVFAILGFTFISELIGALLLAPLWKDLPWEEQLFYSVFHSVSSFCNAGFCMMDDSLIGLSDRWQIWGVIPALIILGGLGFAVLYNLSAYLLCRGRRLVDPGAFRSPQSRVPLRLTTKLVLITTLSLLVSGTVIIYLLERASYQDQPIGLVDAWFQSVALRTAGFNTVDIGHLRPSTKLIGIIFMVIGASPGSTGGGVKTTVFAVAIVGLISVLRGRDRVETFGRTIPGVNVNRALAILMVFIITMLVSTLLVTVFQQRPDLFLDHLFEVTSALGTVGLSSTTTLENGDPVTITQTLSSASRVVIVVSMFLGRVGPLTLLLALAGDSPPIRYEYPPERVTLG